MPTFSEFKNGFKDDAPVKRKHRGVKIVYYHCETIAEIKGKGDNEKYKDKLVYAYSPVGMRYPYTLDEAKACIDRLIDCVMKSCGVNEKQAVKILNEN